LTVLRNVIAILPSSKKPKLFRICLRPNLFELSEKQDPCPISFAHVAHTDAGCGPVLTRKLFQHREKFT